MRLTLPYRESESGNTEEMDLAEYLIGAQLFKEMVINAANYLELNKQKLNDLNVFPVPDGDTGTNMMMTLHSAAKEVNACEAENVGELARALSKGALKGARGNSGVILSQIFRGFERGIPVTTKSLTAADFANALQAGVSCAYSAVMKPKEGTILTVAKAMAEESARQIAGGSNFLNLIDCVIEAGQEMLKKTPDMLPVLKEAGVVDAGGAGLIVIYKGFKMAIDGEEVSSELDFSLPKKLPASAMQDISTADIKFGYCTEFFITHLSEHVTQESIDKLRDKLLALGDSLVVVGDPELVKVHVHTNDPGKALQLALRLGQLSKIKIENMREQHSELSGGAQEEQIKSTVPKKPLAIVAVAASDGLAAIFKDMQVDETVNGGQSMNPSAEDIADAVAKANADTVIILPNNKNIILAAEQAKQLTDKKLFVVPTRSFPQGLSAVIAFEPDKDAQYNAEKMEQAAKEVKSAEITRAVRDTVMNGENITEGQLLGILEGSIVSHCSNIDQTVTELLSKMVDEDDDSVISLYYGESVSEDEAQRIKEFIEEKYEDFDIDMLPGGQPVYDYIISVE